MPMGGRRRCERLTAFGSPTFNQLRPGQRLVLHEYAARHRETRDLGIEMPTGEGKTLVALLIADWALDQGWSVAYLTVA
jgi:superfamily II DNA or RNA helicase